MRPRRGTKSSLAGPGEISLGSVVGVFGRHGELRIHLHDRGSELLHGGMDVTLVDAEGARRAVRIKTRPGTGGRVLAAVGGVTTPEGARDLMGFEIVVEAALLPELEEGIYYHRQLLGLEVVEAGGRALGRLTEIHDSGPVDVWTVVGEATFHVPATSEHVLEVDVASGRITVVDGF
ncbi:MAG TPA: ribosome maturation factor RimM [Myxococcota bacterium]|nr:ribosome maturation factor RimM [Myxococcota bacterium]